MLMLKNFATLLYQNNLLFPYSAVIFATLNSERLVAGYTRGRVQGERWFYLSSYFST